MNKAFRLMICFLVLAVIWVQPAMRARAQEGRNSFLRHVEEPPPLPITALPRISKPDYTSLILPVTPRNYLLPPLIFTNDTAEVLHEAISAKLGIRYRFYGTDDRGYDCSGFVWRVFQDAGADFERVAARTLWAQLPEVSDEEAYQFGTLVFFNGLKHVGIVRDAFSFYHASRSQGVTLSYFSGYWGKRITGFRRAPAPMTISALD